MTRFTLLLRSIRYFRAANIAVAAGMAVATTVLTGALLVGDSVRGSLRELALQRLGPIDHALLATHFFNESLATRLTTSQFDVVSALLVRGGASDPTGRHRTGGVQIAAVGGDWLPVEAGMCVINRTLADALDTDTALPQTLLLQVPTPGDVPRDATLARRAADDVTSRPRAQVSRIESEPGLASMFSLEGGQRLPRNAWMNLADLQREVRQPGRANILFARAKQGASVDELNRVMRGAIALDDYGLRLSASQGGSETVLSSRTTYIRPAVEKAADRVAAKLGVPLTRVAVQLVNNVVRVDVAGAEQARIHYAVAAGISSLGGQTLADDEVALNEWATSRLNAKVGDRIRLDYYQRRPDGELEEVRSDRAGVGLTFRVARILPMSGLGADRSLTPDYPGLTDKAHIREAPPELGIKEDLLNDDDEAYWNQYRAAPKLFLSLNASRRLWGDTYGQLTSLRIPVEHAERFQNEMLRELDPADMGMIFRPIKAHQLAAASGSTDFSALFMGLSFFLIASAAMLVAMLFRLSVEQRARQVGLLQSIGFTPGSVCRMAVLEGFILSCVGGTVGVAGAVFYTRLIVTGLKTWWVDAVGTTALQTHVRPMTLVIGFLAGVGVAMLAVVWAARQLRRFEPVELLGGAWSGKDRLNRSRFGLAKIVTALGFIVGAATIIVGAAGILSAQTAFFGGGTLLLIGAIAAVAWMLRSGYRSDARSSWSLNSFAFGTATRHPARSLLTVALIALASFLLVSVAAFRQGPPRDPGLKNSGTGGYRLILHADIPLLADLNTVRGREQLGMREPSDLIWKNARFTSLRRWAGQDASCLNLTRPDSPTILGVPHDLVDQRRFEFAHAEKKVENPWTLLESPTSETDDIPVIADHDTAAYILKVDVGDRLPITDQSGAARELRIVATLKGSIFQSELLMSEANFRRLFPFSSGFGVVLAETDAAHAEELRRRLNEELDAFAVTVDATSDRLMAYRQVANTYLSTFQTLGSLGLLLGTAGLAVVLLRGLLERRAELALLSAIGFGPGRRLALVLSENASLLIAGLLTGTLCAVVAIFPALVSTGQSVHLAGLGAVLAAVLCTGLLVLAAAAWYGGRNVTPADLRRE